MIFQGVPWINIHDYSTWGLFLTLYIVRVMGYTINLHVAIIVRIAHRIIVLFNFGC